MQIHGLQRTADWSQGTLLITMRKIKLISGLYHMLSLTERKFLTDIYSKQLQNLKHVNRHAYPKTICWIKRCPFLPFRVEHKLHTVDAHKSMCMLKSLLLMLGDRDEYTRHLATKKDQCFFTKITQEWKVVQLQLTPYSFHVVSEMVHLLLQSNTTQQSYSVQEVCIPMQEVSSFGRRSGFHPSSAADSICDCA